MFRCSYCGQFMSLDDVRSNSVVYTPYGGAFDVDPPAERIHHGKCWDKQHKGTGVVAWIGPIDNRLAA